ncbi:MAG: hypothetical protein JW791_04285 [Nanoarchaeota archaeon]|nr:hypothetical protein [Nanoarchaeota archaeon]
MSLVKLLHPCDDFNHGDDLENSFTIRSFLKYGLRKAVEKSEFWTRIDDDYCFLNLEGLEFSARQNPYRSQSEDIKDNRFFKFAKRAYDYGFRILKDKENHVSNALLPVPEELLPKRLMHVVNLNASDKDYNEIVEDNIKSVENGGVWGAVEGFTYVQLFREGKELISCVNSATHCVGQIRLILDTHSLLKTRDLYIDPECINDGVMAYELGSSFYLKDGIPAEAIEVLSQVFETSLE